MRFALHNFWFFTMLSAFQRQMQLGATCSSYTWALICNHTLRFSVRGTFFAQIYYTADLHLNKVYWWGVWFVIIHCNYTLLHTCVFWFAWWNMILLSKWTGYGLHDSAMLTFAGSNHNGSSTCVFWFAWWNMILLSKWTGYGLRDSAMLTFAGSNQNGSCGLVVSILPVPAHRLQQMTLRTGQKWAHKVVHNHAGTASFTRTGVGGRQQT